MFDSTGVRYSILVNPAEADEFNPFSSKEIRGVTKDTCLVLVQTCGQREETWLEDHKKAQPLLLPRELYYTLYLVSLLLTYYGLKSLFAWFDDDVVQAASSEDAYGIPLELRPLFKCCFVHQSFVSGIGSVSDRLLTTMLSPFMV